MRLQIINTLFALSTSIVTSDSFSIPHPNSISLHLPPLPKLSQLAAKPVDLPPIHKPVCFDRPGTYTPLLCARLLTGLKSLPIYTQEKIWSEYAWGSTKLPAIFFQQGNSPADRCYLTIDRYKEVPETQYEQFSLRDEQRELNHIYFGCLKKYDAAGYERIGKWGYAVALLGPPLSRAGGLAEGFASNGTEDGVEPAMIELKGTEMDPIFL